MEAHAVFQLTEEAKEMPRVALDVGSLRQAQLDCHQVKRNGRDTSEPAVNCFSEKKRKRLFYLPILPRGGGREKGGARKLA